MTSSFMVYKSEVKLPCIWSADLLGWQIYIFSLFNVNTLCNNFGCSDLVTLTKYLWKKPLITGRKLLFTMAILQELMAIMSGQHNKRNLRFCAANAPGKLHEIPVDACGNDCSHWLRLQLFDVYNLERFWKFHLPVAASASRASINSLR